MILALKHPNGTNQTEVDYLEKHAEDQADSRKSRDYLVKTSQELADQYGVSAATATRAKRVLADPEAAEGPGTICIKYEPN